MNFSGIALQFGVTIKDFNYLNSFRNLLNVTYEIIQNNSFSVEELLRYHEGTLPDRLLLKERITVGCPIRRLKIPTGTYLWVIRHFLIMLPKPLMNTGKRNHWMKLSDICRVWLDARSFSSFSSKDLVQQIFKDIMLLTEYNQIMCFYFFDFLRKLSTISDLVPPKLNKSTALALSKYFSTAIFICLRNQTNINIMKETHLVPLVLFIITKWSDISTEFVRQNSTCTMFLENKKVQKEKSMIVFFERQKRKNPQNIAAFNSIRRPPISSGRRTRITISSQTDAHCSSSFDLENDFSEIKSEKIDFLKDFGCQTEKLLKPLERASYPLVRSCCWCCQNGRNFKNERLIDGFSQTETDPEEIEEKSISASDVCYISAVSSINNTCFISANCKVPEEEEEETPEQAKLQELWKVPEEEPPKQTKLQEIPNRNDLPVDSVDISLEKKDRFSPENLLIPDFAKNYWNFCENVENQSSPNKICQNLTDDFEKLDRLFEKETLLEKISSIGWSYCPPNTISGKIEEKLSNKHADIRYRLNFDRFNNKDRIEEVIEEEDLHPPLKIFSDDDVAVKSSKKHLKFGKLKAHMLDFISNSSTKIRKSLSFHNIKTNVKYRKM